MTVHIVLIIAAGLCGVGAIIDANRPWAGLGILALAVALLV